MFLFIRVDYEISWKDKFIYAGKYGWDEEPIYLNYFFFLFPIWWSLFSATIGFVLAGFINYLYGRIHKK
jgi:hypothetical protein